MLQASEAQRRVGLLGRVAVKAVLEPSHDIHRRRYATEGTRQSREEGAASRAPHAVHQGIAYS